MAEDWQRYPEMAAANITQNVWVKLAAQFKSSQRVAKSFNDSMQKLLDEVETQFKIENECNKIYNQLKNQLSK